MAKFIKFELVGGGPNNPTATTAYNPTGGLTVPFYVNVDRIRAVSPSASGNYPQLTIWIEGGGAGFNTVTTASEILKIYGTSNADAAEKAKAAERAVKAIVDILENTSEDSSIVDFPVVAGFQTLSMDVAFS
jgi:hypothetical protein